MALWQYWPWSLLCFPYLVSSNWRNTLKTLFRLFTIGFLLALLYLALQSSTALAQTNTRTYFHPSQQQHVQTILLLNTRYGVEFSQRMLTCNKLQPNYCWFVKNVTNHPIKLDYNGKYWITLQPGKTAGTIYASYGWYNYSIERSRFAQLTVMVQRPMVNRCGRYSCLKWWYKS